MRQLLALFAALLCILFIQVSHLLPGPAQLLRMAGLASPAAPHAGSGAQPAATPDAQDAQDAQDARAEFRQWLADTFHAHPDLLLQALEQHNETLFLMVENGLQTAQAKAAKAQRLSQLLEGPRPAIDESRPSFGPRDAVITIVEFSDFQCPYCAQAARTLELLQKKYASQVRVFFKHMPLSSHEHAQNAAALFEAAGMQDQAKAWQLYHRFFQGQQQIKEKGVAWMMDQAKELGLDMDRLNRDAVGPTVLTRIKADLEEAAAFKLGGTPSFIINGVTVSGALSIEEFSEIVAFVLTNDPAIAVPQVPAAGTAPAPAKPGAKDNATCTECP